MRYLFTYDKRSSTDFGIWISGWKTFDAPERDIDTINIPGRSGSLTIDNKRFHNIQLEYESVIREDFTPNIDGLRAFLLSKPGYRRLEDSFHPGEYRRARYLGGMEIQPSQMYLQGHFTITFDCDPRRFLKLGEQEKEYTASGTINNPTFYESKPLLRVYGTGQLGIGGETITINSTDGYTDIDCEQQNAFYGAVNCNGRITLSSRDFPVLPAGKSSINLGSGITKVIVTPRWYTI